MIPVIVTGLAVASATLNVMVGAAAAGAGYGIGRKYGRKICEALDGIDTSMKNMLKKE
tara:strand:- start:822 stop:995 length:174 start_codon:yes stop_codon:yes gene_type:complete